MRAVTIAIVLCFAPIATARAQTSPSPSPSPTAAPQWSVHGFGSTTFIDQATWGPGQTPPEGPAFANGSNPAAPMSPYDWFTTNPLTPGVAGGTQYTFDAAYRAKTFTADATFLTTGLAGSMTNALYWGEPVLGPLDSHEGRSPIPFRIVFPTHAGTDDITAGQIVVPYAASIASNDGEWRVSGGYVTPSAYDAFVYTPTQFSSWLPSFNEQPYMSPGPGIADLDAWKHYTTSIPALGADATATLGPVRIEGTDALLPSLPGTAARLFGFTAALDRGDAGRFSVDWINVTTWGAPVTVPALFGSSPQLHPGAQGDLASSTLGNQSQTIAGARAFFHPGARNDVTAEFGKAWYDAGVVARPGTAHPGIYEHLAFAHRFSDSADAGIEYYRFDPRYATAVLPYGVAENVWGIAWAYPGPWLKGTYQLVNDQFAGANRTGPRIHADFSHGRLHVNTAYYSYRQLEPSTYDNLTQTGFVEVDYLSEAPGDVTLGRTQGASAYAGWQLDRDTFGIDFERDTQYRPYNGGAIGDFVDMRYPEIVLSERHQFAKNLVAVAGYGRYAAGGTWTTTPISDIYGLGFLGAQWDFDGSRQQLFVTLRRYGLTGLPSIPNGLPPTLRGTAIVIDHHIAF